LRGFCVSSAELNRLICSKESLSPPWKLWFPGVIKQKLTSFSWKKCARCCRFWHCSFSFERYLCFFNTAESAYFDQTESISVL
jgi:hypothetical protein